MSCSLSILGKVIEQVVFWLFTSHVFVVIVLPSLGSNDTVRVLALTSLVVVVVVLVVVVT